MTRNFKVGDRIKYNNREATIIGFIYEDSKKFFQIEYDKIPDNIEIGHEGMKELYDDDGNCIIVGYGKKNRYNVREDDKNIKLIDDVKVSNEVYTKIIDKNSIELEKQGIARI
jgi:hypothetical protein